MLFQFLLEGYQRSVAAAFGRERVPDLCVAPGEVFRCVLACLLVAFVYFCCPCVCVCVCMCVGR